jgi:hypothetical protein
MHPVRKLAITWLLLVSTGCSSYSAPLRGAPEGTWQGQITWRGASLECSVRFRSDGDSLRAWFNSPDLLLLGVPLDSVRFKQRRIRFVTTDDHRIAFEGTVAGDSITGTVRIGAVPGVVEPGAGGVPPRLTLRRTIVLPPPYAIERVTFRSDSVELGGTVYLPEAPPHTLPGVVILQGSSANLRDAYHFYADHFARTGFAVLVFDKRGHGESGGDYGAATYEDLARDAAAAVGAAARPSARGERARRALGPEPWGRSSRPWWLGAWTRWRSWSRSRRQAWWSGSRPPTRTASGWWRPASAPRDANAAATLDRRLLDWLGSGHDPRPTRGRAGTRRDTPWRRASALPRYLPSGARLDELVLARAHARPAALVARAQSCRRSWCSAPPTSCCPRAAECREHRARARPGRERRSHGEDVPGANHVLRTLPLVAGGAWDWPRAAPGYLDLVTEWMRAHARSNPKVVCCGRLLLTGSRGPALAAAAASNLRRRASAGGGARSGSPRRDLAPVVAGPLRRQSTRPGTAARAAVRGSALVLPEPQAHRRRAAAVALGERFVKFATESDTPRADRGRGPPLGVGRSFSRACDSRWLWRKQPRVRAVDRNSGLPAVRAWDARRHLGGGWFVASGATDAVPAGSRLCRRSGT